MGKISEAHNLLISLYSTESCIKLIIEEKKKKKKKEKKGGKGKNTEKNKFLIYL